MMKIKIMMLLVLALLCGTVNAEVSWGNNWRGMFLDGQGRVGSWAEVDNWSDPNLPEAVLYDRPVVISDGDCFIYSDLLDAGCYKMQLPAEIGTDTPSLSVYGALTVLDYMLLANPNPSNAVLNVDGGSVSIGNYFETRYGTAEINIINNSTVNIAADIKLANRVGGVATINITDSTLDVSSYINVASDGTATIDMDNSTLSCTHLSVPTKSSGTGSVYINNSDVSISGHLNIGNNGCVEIKGTSTVTLTTSGEYTRIWGDGGQIKLHGGTLKTPELILSYPGLDIANDGELRLAGDVTSAMTVYVTDGFITGSGQWGAVAISYDAQADETVLTVGSAGTLPIANNPSPARDAANQNGYQLQLDWGAAPGATTHYLYFGMSEAEVTNATPSSACYVGPITPPYTGLDELLSNTTYYWRVDEYISGGGISTGEVWSFTVGYELMEGFDYTDEAEMLTVWSGGSFYNDSSTYVGVTLPAGQSWAAISRAYATAIDIDDNTYKVIRVRVQDADEVGSAYLELKDGAGNSFAKVVTGLNTGSREYVYIALSDYSAAGVDLSNIVEITLGAGNPAGGVSLAADAEMYFDSLLITDSICLGGNPAMDFTNDCKVNLADFAVFAESWLKSNIFPAE